MTFNPIAIRAQQLIIALLIAKNLEIKIGASSIFIFVSMYMIYLQSPFVRKSTTSTLATVFIENALSNFSKALTGI